MPRRGQPGDYVMIAVTRYRHRHPARDPAKRSSSRSSPPRRSARAPGSASAWCYGFVKQSGGHIKIYSEEGHGTSVKHLSAARHPARTCSSRAARHPPPQGRRANHLRRRGRCAGPQICVAQVAKSRLSHPGGGQRHRSPRVIGNTARFDLLFTDVILSGSMNGRQLADEALKRRPAIKTLFTSGYSETAIIHHGRLDTGVLLLAKPYRRSDMARMIRLALER